MMNGAEKSDPLIVPVKPANKAAQAVAESAEGSGGTKRNADRQSTDRTQSRKDVSQAQARIRDAVTRNRKEKLTALLHHISIEAFEWAFLSLKKHAAPGVDGLTWDDYATNLEANLADLHERVHPERIERCHPGESTSRNPMADNGRSASPPWRIKSSRPPWWPS